MSPPSYKLAQNVQLCTIYDDCVSSLLLQRLPNIFGWKRNTPCGLAQAKGETWKKARQILSPTFSAAKMKAVSFERAI